MIQHFLAREIGTGLRQISGAMDGKRPAGVDTLPAGTQWLNCTWDTSTAQLVRVDAADAVLTAYAAQPNVLALPRDLSETVKANQLAAIRNACDSYGIPRHWIAAGLLWDDVVRWLWRMLSLGQRLRGASKKYLSQHLVDNGLTLSSTWASLPAGVQTYLRNAADSLGMDYSMVTGATTLREMLYEVGKTWAKEPWVPDPPLAPGTIDDNFERASLGTNWTDGPGSYDPVTLYASSDIGPSAVNRDCAAFYSAVAWNAAQSGEVVQAVTLDPGPGEEWIMAVVRCAADGDSYQVSWNENLDVFEFWAVANGATFTQLGVSVAGAMGIGVKLKASISGSTLDGLKDDVSFGTRSDSTYTSGSAGLACYIAPTGTPRGTIESWRGVGNVAAPVFTQRRSMRAMVRR